MRSARGPKPSAGGRPKTREDGSGFGDRGRRAGRGWWLAIGRRDVLQSPALGRTGALIGCDEARRNPNGVGRVGTTALSKESAGPADPVDAIVPPVDSEAVEVEVGPAEGDLDRVMEIGECGVGAHQEPPPDHGADVPDPDVDLVDLGRRFIGHGPSQRTRGRPRSSAPGLSHSPSSPRRIPRSRCRAAQPRKRGSVS